MVSPAGRPTANTSSCRSRGRRTRARSGCSCITATAAPACASARRRRRSPARTAQGPPPPPPTNRMGAVVSPDGRFIYYAQRTGTFTYNARFPLWQIYRHDRETGDVVAGHQRAGQRDAAGDLARRQVAGLRHAPQDADRPARAQSRDRRRAVAAYPVTRDDQESRASRDTLPRYDFMPDGKSLIVPIGGKLQRVDFATGDARADPVHRAGAGRDRAARLHAGARGRRRHGARAADPLAVAVARRQARWCSAR